jgi:hypothetical protein
MLRKFLPSGMVVVRRYGASVNGYPDVAHNDQKLLLENGIEAWVKYGWAPRFGGGAFVMVPRDRAHDAAEVLGSSPNLFPAGFPPIRCPRCHNAHPERRPAYAAMVLGLGFLVIGVAERS